MLLVIGMSDFISEEDVFVRDVTWGSDLRVGVLYGVCN